MENGWVDTDSKFSCILALILIKEICKLSAKA
jgi:hypothetical protein